jgi:hypothetical protein
MDFLFGFQADKFKPYCKMAVQRLQIAKNKKTNAIKVRTVGGHVENGRIAS